jgi:hypothetical protein
MSNTLKLAAVISILLGAIASLTLGIFTASYTARAADGSYLDVVVGSEAAISLIQEFGLLHWLAGLGPFAVAFTAFIFIGCILQGVLQNGRS